jgi:hypothetical protein
LLFPDPFGPMMSDVGESKFNSASVKFLKLRTQNMRKRYAFSRRNTSRVVNPKS